MFKQHFFTLLAFFALTQISHAQCVGGNVLAASGESTVYTCPGDGNADMVEFTVEGASEDTDYQFVVTDSDFNIVGIPPGNAIDVEGAGEGTCYVWGLAYTGDLTVTTGMNVFQAQVATGCWNLSKKALKVVRSAPDAGTVALNNGLTEKTICTADGYDNIAVYTNTSSSNAAFRYVVTDDSNNILAVLSGTNQNFEGVPPGVCRVWGLSYTGNLTAMAGDNAAEVALSDACFDLSDNYITVTRSNVDGGTVATADGQTSITTVPGDGISDAITFMHETTSMASFAYFVTDENNKIIGTPSGNTVDFEGAGEGVCRLWGVSYTGDLKYLLGGTVGNFALSTDCFEVSENFVEVVRSAGGACAVDGGEISTEAGTIRNRAVIANRASGTISVINGDAGILIDHYDMPNDGQPMYVVHNALNNTVLVGDYNGQVVAFDGKDFSVAGSVAAGEGVFHMWISSDYQQLWVNNELDKTVSVVNPTTLESITTFSIPSDLIDNGFKPHDVIVDPDNSAAYVTMINGAEAVNYVVKYDASTFEEIDRAEVGADPHVSLTAANDLLYVASQGADLLQVLERDDLDLVTTIDVPNAHGLGMNAAGTHLYIGNISEGGTDATYVLDLATNTLVGEPTDAPYAAPHNYAVGSNDSKLYLTHSGMTSYKVSMYDLTPSPTLVGEFNTGMNPFGLAAYSFTDTELTICALDGESDAFDVALEGNTGNSAWVITDTDGTILGLPPGPPFDLDGAGAGTCLIWHVSFEDGLTGVAVGNNALTDLEGCYALSNPITVVREVVNGGTVSTPEGTTEVSIIAGDGIADVIEFAHEGNSDTDFRYVITDEAGTILGLPPGSSLDFEGAGAGVCLVWGLAYTGEVTAMAGDNATEVALSSGCFDLSDNFIKVTRMASNLSGGTVAMPSGATEKYTCANDGISDVIMVVSEGATEEANFTLVVTDPDGNILGVPPANMVDVTGAGVGTCLVWGLTYTGDLTAMVGDNAMTAMLASGDAALSSNYITLNRDEANGGTVAMPSGATEISIIAGDGEADVIEFTNADASNSNYAYVVTDTDGNILGLPPGNSLDFEGAGEGVCLVWGLAYTGEITAMMGDNATEVALSSECFDLSDNYITVTRTASLSGGTIAMPSGATEKYTCANDGIDDVIMTVSSGATSSANFTLVVTDPDGNILGVPPADMVNVTGAGVGTCLVWGLAYTGDLTAMVGDNAMTAMLASGDAALSSNYITLNRDEANGGTVSTPDGATEVNTAPGDGEADIVEFAHADASNSNYTYVITDEAGTILGLPPGNSLDFEGAGEGVCLVWGLAYTGEITAMMGDNATEVALSSECFDLSDNFIRVTRGSSLPSNNQFGLTSSTNNVNFNLFPNPVSELLNVNVNSDLEANNTQITVFDALGKIVLQKQEVLTVGNNTYQLNISDLIDGMYILSISNSNIKQSSTFIKN